MGEIVRTKYQYISFELVDKKPKTGVWACRNIHHGEVLGIIKWHPGWRQYCYFPSIQGVYSRGCLDDIGDFIEQLRPKKGGR